MTQIGNRRDATTGRIERSDGLYSLPGATSTSPKPTSHLFWSVAYVYLVLLAGTNLPTPLYHSYEHRFGFSPLVVTLIFSAYVGVLIPSLLLAGPLSDAIGRRRVLLPAVGIAVLACLLFMLASGTAWLFAARAAQGLAVGAASGALTATLIELEPHRNPGRAGMVSAIALFGGIGAGPLLCGVLAEYVPGPRVTPYLVEIALLLLAATAVARLPERSERSQWRPRRPQVPHQIRAPFTTAGTMSFLAGTVTGVFLTLVPSYLLKLTSSTNLALAGAAVALMFAASAAIQKLAYRRPLVTLRVGGIALVMAGFVQLILAGSASSLALLLIATLTAGVGQGLLFLAAVTQVNQIAPTDRRAGVLSSFYVVTYMGTGLPVIGVGFLATSIGLLTAVQYFAGAVAIGCAIALVSQSTRYAATRRLSRSTIEERI